MTRYHWVVPVGAALLPLGFILSLHLAFHGWKYRRWFKRVFFPGRK